MSKWDEIANQLLCLICQSEPAEIFYKLPWAQILITKEWGSGTVIFRARYQESRRATMVSSPRYDSSVSGLAKLFQWLESRIEKDCCRRSKKLRCEAKRKKEISAPEYDQWPFILYCAELTHCTCGKALDKGDC